MRAAERGAPSPSMPNGPECTDGDEVRGAGFVSVVPDRRLPVSGPETKEPSLRRARNTANSDSAQGSKPFLKIRSVVAVIVKFGAEMLKKMLPTQETRTRAPVVATLGTVIVALPLFGKLPTFSG